MARRGPSDGAPLSRNVGDLGRERVVDPFSSDFAPFGGLLYVGSSPGRGPGPAPAEPAAVRAFEVVTEVFEEREVS